VGRKGHSCPPCFIIVCQNTAISKLVYDFVSGFHRKNEDGTTTLQNTRFTLFRNFDETTGNPLPRPNTLLIDSEQLEAGDALDATFAAWLRMRSNASAARSSSAAGTPARRQHHRSGVAARVMNTVGKLAARWFHPLRGVCLDAHGRLGCESVTHVLGIRAFGTQLLCEQVIGRALRRNPMN